MISCQLSLCTVNASFTGLRRYGLQLVCSEWRGSLRNVFLRVFSLHVTAWLTHTCPVLTLGAVGEFEQSNSGVCCLMHVYVCILGIANHTCA